MSLFHSYKKVEFQKEIPPFLFQCNGWDRRLKSPSLKKATMDLTVD